MNTEKLTTLIHYHGEINGPIISELLDDLDFKCINHDVSDIKRKKLFNIAVEMFQNLYHYTRDLSLNGLEDHEARKIDLSFELDDDAYFLITSNLIKNEDEDILKLKISKVNQMDTKELKAYYKKVLSNEEFSDKGGAGLGFIDMKKRSGNNLEYEIEPINQDIKKYSLKVKVTK
jgi:6-pyruvoyl-tetrahydropterin synthase